MPASTSTATLFWSPHVCKLRHFLAGYSGRSGHPYLSSNTVSDPWVQRPEHSPWAQSSMENWDSQLTEPYFHPKLNAASISSPNTTQNNNAGSLRYMAKPLEISLSHLFVNVLCTFSVNFESICLKKSPNRWVSRMGGRNTSAIFLLPNPAIHPNPKCAVKHELDLSF